jgi:hypothetical protein
MALIRLTSADYCYNGAHGTCVVPTSPNNSDVLSDISEPLLLLSTGVMSYMTSDDRCYCWARGTARLLLALTVAMGILTSLAH